MNNFDDKENDSPNKRRELESPWTQTKSPNSTSSCKSHTSADILVLYQYYIIYNIIKILFIFMKIILLVGNWFDYDILYCDFEII